MSAPRRHRYLPNNLKALFSLSYQNDDDNKPIQPYITNHTAAGCSTERTSTRKMVRLEQEEFGSVGGKPVRKFTWTTDDGFSLTAISYGAVVQSIQFPDKDGTQADVVLGFDDIDGYARRNTPYLGAVVGRCANRIAGAGLTIDGVDYKLANNIGENHLHGGVIGFDKKIWDTTVEDNKVIFSCYSKDGEEGYPGDLVSSVTYEVRDNWSLHVEFLATTAKKTVVNLTNHSYFNLAGHDAGAAELYNHVVAINADCITETNAASIPTGRLLAVGGTPYDLRTGRRLGDVMDKAANLYDDNFCVNHYGNKGGVSFVSRVVHPPSGRFLEVRSDQPGVQFYTGNALPAPREPALSGKGGSGYRRHGGLCLETQNFPDAVHHPGFPKVTLRPGEVYRHLVVYTFGVVKSVEPVVIAS